MSIPNWLKIWMFNIGLYHCCLPYSRHGSAVSLEMNQYICQVIYISRGGGEGDTLQDTTEY